MICWRPSSTVRGLLYELPYGFPALVVPDLEVRTTGTTNYLADAVMQRFLSSAADAPPSGWDTVYGELLFFDDPERRLVALDGLEGYVLSEESLYERVLVPVGITDVVVLA